MLIELGVAGTFYALSYVYHRYTDHKPKDPQDPAPALSIPSTTPGTPVPLIFGRCRVQRPLLAWMSPRDHVSVYLDSGVYTTDPSDTPSHVMYSADLLFVVGYGMGAGFNRGSSLSGNKLHNVWLGDRKLPSPGSLPKTSVTLRFGQAVNRVDDFDVVDLRGAYFWHGGWTDQLLVAPYASRIGDRWGAVIGDPTLVPGLAKQMLVSFVKMPEDGADPYFDQTFADPGAPGSFEAQPLPATGFIVGRSPAVSTVGVEVSSYGDIVGGVTDHVFAMTNPGVDFGGDADPIECIYDWLTGTSPGKLALSTSLIDMDSFRAASVTLKSENHGYSRCADSSREAGEWIEEICQQIDAVPRFNRRTRKYEIKLIRPDYNPRTIAKIHRKNCRDLRPGGMSGWSNIINAVRVKYPNRDKDYEDDSEAAQNGGNVDGSATEEVISYPGCTRAALAQQLAARELAWRSKPIMKMTALVDRSLLRVLVGDPVLVNWTDPDISNLVFRVAAVNHGTLKDREIVLSLVQDVNYVWRLRSPHSPFGPHLREKKGDEDPRLE